MDVTMDIGLRNFRFLFFQHCVDWERITMDVTMDLDLETSGFLTRLMANDE